MRKVVFPCMLGNLVSILFIMLWNQLRNYGIAPTPPKARKFQIKIYIFPFHHDTPDSDSGNLHNLTTLHYTHFIHDLREV